MTDATAQNQQLITAYRLTFGNPAGQMVLADLMRFSGFRRPLDGDHLAIEEGKRRLFLRIAEMIELTDEQLLALYAGRRLKLSGANE